MKSIDKILIDLFNQAALSPLGTKAIYLSSEKGLIDCRSINPTTNNGGSRIPHEQTINAIQVLQKCYAELNQLEALFFMYYYGACNNLLAQLVAGVSILSNTSKEISQHSIKGYRDGYQPLAELAKLLDMDYKQLDYQCGKVRRVCAILQQNVELMIEDVLIKEGLL